ncbi:MAG: ABC transporter ATP-binding protein [Bacteroidota bacterium]|nr:ABC transporter ATP-binding protein [Bacteroidota bacterium]
MFISAKNIFKNYGSTQALSDISFEVNKNELFGFIGPDGAGKTTLFRILTTLLLADKGSATINGWDVVNDFKTIRNNVGYMPGRFSLYQDLSVEENLTFFATIFGTTIEENYDLIRDIYVQIEPFKKRLAGKLSGGMKQKLALSCALIHAPELLVLDEPTTGVDAVSRKEFWEMLRNLRDKGITIIVSTPYMDEASLCDRVALMQNGKIMQIDTPQHIVGEFPRKLYAVRSSNMYSLKDDLLHFPEQHSVHLFGQYLHFTAREREADILGLRHYLEGKNHQNIIIEAIEPGIEDCFIELMTENSASNEN